MGQLLLFAKNSYGFQFINLKNPEGRSGFGFVSLII